MPSVAFGPKFFANTKNDYSNWYWATAREFLQNGIDGRSTVMKINVSTEGAKTLLTVENNGKEMAEEVLIGKLLTLGETTKDGINDTGGMGVAKLILYFMHNSYRIETGHLVVTGSGGEYTLSKSTDRVHGVKNTIVMDGDHRNDLIGAVKAWAFFAQWSGSLFLNGQELGTSCRKGAFRRELDFGKVYTNNVAPGRVVVRMHGQPMFYFGHSIQKCVIVELSRTAGVLTSNRDGLCWPYSNQLSQFCEELAINKRSALAVQDVTEYRHYAGALSIATPEPEQIEEALEELAGDDAEALEDAVVKAISLADEEDASVSTTEINKAALMATSVEAPTKWTSTTETEGESYDFSVVIKNTTGMTIPAHYLPGSFSKYAEQVLKVYRAALLKVHKILGLPGQFSVGFHISDDSIGEHEEHPDYGHVYYINPVKVVKQANSPSRSLARRFSLDAEGRYDIIATAAHEVVHGAYGCLGHDEGFACKLTSVMAVLLYKRNELAGVK